jgi:hypothetical protein
MNKFLNSLCVAAAVALAIPASAQMPARISSTGGKSPHETTSGVIDGNRVTITYGRPFMKGRKIWGGLVPWNEAWRMGADEATILITEQPITIGSTTIPAGAYSLYMMPSESGTSKLTFSKKIGQWGEPVDQSGDLAAVDLKKEPLDAPVEEYTMAIKKNSAGGGDIVMKWDNAQYTVTFTVSK